MDFTVQQWERIAAAPVTVFLLMAFGDLVISTAEQEVFFKEWSPRLMKIKLAVKPGDQAIFEWGLGEAEVSARQFMRLRPAELLEKLEDTFTVLGREPDTEKIEAFRSELMALARDVAKASGGLFGLRSPVSPDEEEMLMRVRHALRGRPIL